MSPSSDRAPRSNFHMHTSSVTTCGFTESLSKIIFRYLLHMIICSKESQLPCISYLYPCTDLDLFTYITHFIPSLIIALTSSIPNMFHHTYTLLLFTYYPIICHCGINISPTSLTDSIACRKLYTHSTTFSIKTHYYSFSYDPSLYSSNQIMFDSCGSSFDTYLYLYRDDTTIWSWITEGNDDGDCGTQEQLSISDIEAGTYILGVSGATLSDYGSYTFVIFCDSNLICASEISGSTTAAYDADYYRVTLSLPDIAMADEYSATNLIPAILFNGCTGTNYDSFFYLFDTDYNELAQNDDSDHCSSNTYSQLAVTDLAPGDYILKVAGWSSSFGDYGLSFECFHPYDVCINDAVSVTFNRVYKFDHYDSKDVGLVHYNAAVDRYIYPYLWPSGTGRWYLGRNHSDNTVNAYCNMGSVGEQGYVFNLDDCIGEWIVWTGSWVSDPDMTVTNCQEVCSSGHYDASMDGVYFYDHFDITRRGAVYYCSFCNSGMYLYPMISVTSYYWMFGADYNELSWLSWCDVSTLANSIGADYVFKLEHCANQWMSYNGTDSISWSIDTDICYATLSPTFSPSAAPSYAPSHATLSPSNAPTTAPSAAPTTSPTIAPTPSTPTAAPTFTDKYVYVRETGCDYGYCTDFSSDYSSGCSSDLNEFNSDLFSNCCIGPTPAPLPAVSTYVPTCQSITYSWQCFLGFGGYPNATGCAQFDANGVYDLGAGIWHFPFQINFDDNNIIIQGQSETLTTLNYIGDEAIWVTCRWPKCWIALKHLSIASNRSETNDVMFSMPNGGTLYVEDVLFDGNNYLVNQNEPFWNFIHPSVVIEFHDCNFVNNDVLYMFKNGVNALFHNCTFSGNTVTNQRFTASQAMWYIDDAYVTFDACHFIANLQDQRSLFSVLNGGDLVVVNCVFMDNIVADKAMDNKMFYVVNGSLNITQTSFTNNTGLKSVFHIENGVNIYFDTIEVCNNSDIVSFIWMQSLLWSNDAFLCIEDNMADIEIVASSFVNNDVDYLLNINGSEMHIDDLTYFTDNLCNESCILSTDSSLNINGDTRIFNQNDVFLVFAHDSSVNIKSSLCIRNELSTAITPYFTCMNCNPNNTKVIFDECSNPYIIPHNITFNAPPNNISATFSHSYSTPERVGGQLLCASNITYCEMHCIGLVSCFASTMISNAVVTNILCNQAFSCQNAEIYAVPNKSDVVSSSLHIICSADSACQENQIIANGHNHFQLDCVTSDSCVDSIVNISNTMTSAINCYAFAACSNMQIYTDNENTSFSLHQFSENVQIYNVFGFTETNLQCGASAAYIVLDSTHDTLSSALSQLFVSDDFYGPCDSVQFICNSSTLTLNENQKKCTMSSSLTRADSEPDFKDYYACYGHYYYKDISHQYCVGSRECGGPTQSPSAAPSFSPTITTLSPSSAPTFSPSLRPTSSPSQPPTFYPTIAPSLAPSFAPTLNPSLAPSSPPTLAPSIAPSSAPSFAPSLAPSAPPTKTPSAPPTIAPSITPSSSPTNTPSATPSAVPTNTPSISPTNTPSVSPTEAPSLAPSVSPSSSPSLRPTSSPSFPPTFSPTLAPSLIPSLAPSLSPSLSPSSPPSLSPSSAPSLAPNESPTMSPSAPPTIAPSLAPSESPTNVPSSIPSAAPSLAPSGTPSAVPSISPSLAPSLAPSVSPTYAPTPIPTRQPTSANQYDSFMDIVYALKSVSNLEVMKIVHSPFNVSDEIRNIVEFGYDADENVVVSFDKFWVQIVEINDVVIVEIDVNDAVSFSQNRDELRLSATMKCDEAICNYIMESYDALQFELFCTLEIRDYFNNIHVNAAANDDDNELQFVVLSASVPMKLNPSSRKATNYVFIITTSMVVILLIVSFWAAIYNAVRCCKLPGFGVVDDGRWGALMIFALQFWDFVSDVNLAIEILANQYLTTDMLILISGVGSVTFVLLPYLANLLIAVRVKELVKRNEAAKAWFQQNTAIFTILVVISGGCYPALAVVSSNIFGLRITSCGLTQYELKQMGKIKILGTILLENLPQLVCQALYSLAIGSITQTVALAFFASFLSVTASSLSYLIDRDSSDTPPVQYYLTTTKVEYDDDDDNDDTIRYIDDDDDDDLNIATVPYKNPNFNTIKSDSNSQETEPKYMIRVTSASTVEAEAEAEQNTEQPKYCDIKSTSTPDSSNEGISAVVNNNTTLTRIASARDASLTHDKNDITPWEKKQFLNNRMRTCALGEQIAEVFAIPPKNIEVGYSNITKKGIITHIVHYVFEEDLESIADLDHLEVSPQMFTEHLCIALSKQLSGVFTKHFALTKGEFETKYSHKKRNRRLTIPKSEKNDEIQIEKKKKVMKRVSHQIKISQNLEMSTLRVLHMHDLPDLHLDDILEEEEEEESLFSAADPTKKAQKALQKLFSSRGMQKLDKKEKLDLISRLLLDQNDSSNSSSDDDDDQNEIEIEEKKSKSLKIEDRYSSKSQSDEHNLSLYLQQITSDQEEDGGAHDNDLYMGSDTDTLETPLGKEFSTQL